MLHSTHHGMSAFAAMDSVPFLVCKVFSSFQSVTGAQSGKLQSDVCHTTAAPSSTDHYGLVLCFIGYLLESQLHWSSGRKAVPFPPAWGLIGGSWSAIVGMRLHSMGLSIGLHYITKRGHSGAVG